MGEPRSKALGERVRRFASRRTLTGSLIAFALIFANPFSALGYLDTASEDLVYKLVAGWLPSNSTKLVVVIADDTYLRDAEAHGQPAGWPLSYGVYSETLARVARANPRALFLDVAFIEPSADPAAESLAESLAFYSKRFPILVAAGSAETGAPRPFMNQIKRVIADGPQTPGARRAPLAVSVLDPTSDGLIHPYSLSPDSDGRPNAAVALLQVTGQTETARVAARLGRIDLVWGLPAAAACSLYGEEFAERVAAGCALSPRDLILRFGQLLWSGLAAGPCGDDRRGTPNKVCALIPPLILAGDPYPVVPLQELLSGNELQMNSLLADSIVVFGQDFAFARDEAYSPIYGMRPASLRIATAYANLTHFGSRALRPLPGVWKLVNQFLTCLVGLALVLRLERRIGSETPLAEVLTAATLLCLALVTAVLQTWMWRIGPENWLGITAVAKLAQDGSALLSQLVRPTRPHAAV